MDSFALQTPRLSLRLLAPDDRAAFCEMAAASAAFWAPWLPTPTPTPGRTPDDLFGEQLDRATRGRRDGTEYRFVGELADGRIAGVFVLAHLVRGAFHNAYASWRVNAAVARRGYGAEGVAGMLDVAFAPPPAGLGLHRVQANIIPDNAASVRLAEKVGFRREGLALRYLQIAGAWRDHAMYAKVADEHGFRYLMPDPVAPEARHD